MAEDPAIEEDRPEAEDGPSLSIGGEDWPANAADTVVRIVDQVKTKTTDNAVLLVRAMVYGIVIAVLGLAIIVLSTVALLRITDAYLPIGNGVGSATWAAHGLLGALLSILGFGACSCSTWPSSSESSSTASSMASPDGEFAAPVWS
jgi:hypothetical protein